ncbi:uracil-DNA glycosylase [Paraburkholderia heleia]|uniref:uracil-DNA glycosylase n=1 Tax=Paraburkholderia heleia TaxID=634127 RepID=UPI000A033F5B|nr:uracil-DNA glycosylase [Paraburkholderia heleia]
MGNSHIDDKFAMNATIKCLRDPAAVESRRAMLTQSHMRPLVEYVQDLRSKAGNEWYFPDMDPLDGGIHADILVLMEKPGRMTNPNGQRIGSGFISRDNNDETAAATSRFFEQAGVSRSRTLLWNAVPGWNRTRDLTRAEEKEGRAEVLNLIELLPKLETIILVGKTAHKAEEIIPKWIRVIKSMHPSPINRGINREAWLRIPEQWALANR